jgi:hypothetical protein
VDEFDLHTNIADGQASDIHHEAVEVPAHASPFIADVEALFMAAFREVQQHNPIPNGYCVSPNEWPSGGYPVCETLKVGSSGKCISVVLPFKIWWRRAVIWSQGLDLMLKFSIESN